MHDMFKTCNNNSEITENEPLAQTVVLQPGEIDPTETTVITVKPPTSSTIATQYQCPGTSSAPARELSPTCTRRTTLPTCPRPTTTISPPPPIDICDLRDFEEFPDVNTSSIRKPLETFNLDFLQEEPSSACPLKPESMAGLGSSCPTCPGLATETHPAYRNVQSVSTEGGRCTMLPEARLCPTNVRSVIARPISTDPNVSVLDDMEGSELLTEQDFGGGFGIEDFHLVRSAPAVTRTPHPTTRQCPRQAPEMAQSCRPHFKDIYEQIERNKEEWRTRQMAKNQEFLRSSRVMREDDPNRIFDRVMTKYYRETDPNFAACYREDWDAGEVPIADLLDVESLEVPVAEEFGPSARELFEMMKEPDFGPYGSELLSSNIQMSAPRSCSPGPYAKELFQNVELLPTTGYTPGRYGSELLAHVDWMPPRVPDPDECLLESFPCPPQPSSNDTCDVADLIDWL